MKNEPMTPSEFASIEGWPEVYDTYTALYESHQKLEQDMNAYKGALGYPVSGEFTGFLTNGEMPKCGMCDARAIQVTKLEAELADSKQINVYLKDKATELAKQTTLVLRYGCHDSVCNTQDPEIYGRVCNCGWDDAKRKLKDAGGE